MPFFVLCKLILQTHMRSHPAGIDVWFLVRPFVYFHTSCVRTGKALARLRGCPGSSEPSLLAYVISTIISWAGSNLYIGTNSSRLIRVYTTVCHFYCSHYMSHLMTKPTKWLCAQQRLSQISLGIRAQVLKRFNESPRRSWFHEVYTYLEQLPENG